LVIWATFTPSAVDLGHESVWSFALPLLAGDFI